MRPSDLPERISRRILVDPSTGCWNWTGYKCPEGYGRTSQNRRPCPAHRLTYAKLIRPIPKGEPLDHLCRNRACVNPAHLELVTVTENNRRSLPFRKYPKHKLSARKSNRPIKTACIHGHTYTDESTYIRPIGVRECRICKQKQRTKD